MGVCRRADVGDGCSWPAVDAGSGCGGWHGEQGRKSESQRQGSDLRKKGSHGRAADGSTVLGSGMWERHRRCRVRWWLSVVGQCLAAGQRDRDRGRRTKQ
uniref:Uncharacterized protein n=1 Tax=Opuntia streptacantha TaxID=393608 RepID=A0A7C8YIV4_OPUST